MSSKIENMRRSESEAGFRIGWAVLISKTVNMPVLLCQSMCLSVTTCDGRLRCSLLYAYQPGGYIFAGKCFIIPGVPQKIWMVSRVFKRN